MKVDLHCHTTVSDGDLSPADLWSHARKSGVNVLSITDHDTTAAYRDLPASSGDLRLIPGIEFSSSWQRMGIHILGLNIDLQNATLQTGIEQQQHARTSRAREIARRLEKYGVENCLEAVTRIAGTSGISRPHFANHLVATGKVKTPAQAFQKYLGQGKSCDVNTDWASMDTVIDWIISAGGTAVVAHPAKYGLTWAKLNRLMTDFSAAGGGGMEVISGLQTSELTRRLARICNEQGLLGSTGSDFHRPGRHWANLGNQSEFPADCDAVWSHWDL
jgi:predicted metal-dependent phosphoesterase TrpH